MPYVKSWNHPLPIKPYRDSRSFHFVDIFDPEEQKQLEVGVKASCEKSLQNHEKLIGYWWTGFGA